MKAHSKLKFYLFSLVFLSVPVAAHAEVASNLYVSPHGDDNGPGTLEAPLRTASEAAKRAIPGTTVILRGGVYRETIAPANSGTEEAPIVFAGYEGEDVLISGADPVTTSWTPYKGKILKTEYTSTLQEGQDEAFIGEQKLTLARWPDQGVATATQGSVGGIGKDSSGNRIAYGSLTHPSFKSNLSAWKGSKIWFNAGYKWSAQTGKVGHWNAAGFIGVNYRASKYTMTPKNGPVGDLGAGTDFYVFDNLSLLNMPGEWFLDREANTLYMIPPSGAGAHPVIEMKTRLYAFDFQNRSHITVRNLKISGATVITNDPSKGITLDGITAHDLYPLRNLPTRYSPGWRSTGIILKGQGHRLLNSTIDGSDGNGVTLAGSGHLVANNTILHTNYAGNYCAGVSVSGSDHTVIHNSISKTGRAAVDLAIESVPKRSLILWNDLSAGMLRTQDGGVISGAMSPGAWSILAYNHVHGVTTRLGVGIYLDGGCSCYAIHHNVVDHTTLGIQINPTHSGWKVKGHHIYAYNNVSSAYSIGFLGEGDTAASPTYIFNNLLSTLNTKRTDMVFRYNSVGRADSAKLEPSLNWYDVDISYFANPANGFTAKNTAAHRGLQVAPFTPTGTYVGAYAPGERIRSYGARPEPIPQEELDEKIREARDLRDSVKRKMPNACPGS